MLVARDACLRWRAACGLLHRALLPRTPHAHQVSRAHTRAPNTLRTSLPLQHVYYVVPCGPGPRPHVNPAPAPTPSLAEEGSREGVDAGCRRLTASWTREKAVRCARMRVCVCVCVAWALAGGRACRASWLLRRWWLPAGGAPHAALGCCAPHNLRHAQLLGCCVSHKPRHAQVLGCCASHKLRHAQQPRRSPAPDALSHGAHSAITIPHPPRDAPGRCPTRTSSCASFLRAMRRQAGRPGCRPASTPWLTCARTVGGGLRCAHAHTAWVGRAALSRPLGGG